MPVRVSKRELRRLNRRGRPVKIRLPAVTSSPEPAVVPPSDGEPQTTLPAPNTSMVKASDASPVPVPKWKLPPNSKVKKTAMKILALRLHGFNDEDIAQSVGLKNASTVRGYMYRAGKNGWLTNEVTTPKDAVEYDLLHKVVRNIGEALDSPDDERRDKMTTKVFEHTLARQFEQDAAGTKPAMTMLAVQVVMPEGQAPTVRDGAAVGRGNIIDAEVV